MRQNLSGKKAEICGAACLTIMFSLKMMFSDFQNCVSAEAKLALAV